MKNLVPRSLRAIDNFKEGSMRKVLAALGCVAFFLGAPAYALPTLTFQLTSDHCTGGCLTNQTSGGTVVVTDNGGGSLTFAIDLLNGNEIINGGFDASFGFNLFGDPVITYSNIIPAANYSLPGGNPQSAGSLHMDGLGFFGYGLEGIGNGGSDPLGSSLDFTITGTGLTLTSLVANAAGQFFGVDIISGTTGFTGGIDASGPGEGGEVPEPGVVGLLGLGLVGLAGLRRRRR